MAPSLAAARPKILQGTKPWSHYESTDGLVVHLPRIPFQGEPAAMATGISKSATKFHPVH
jgi:hypothetical protein